MTENPSYELLVLVKNMLNSEVDPLLETYSQNYQSSPELLQVLQRLNDIYDLISSQRPKYYGLFTCQPSFAITANNQLVPFDVSFGGNILPNADGTFTLPANTDFLIDVEIVASYSATTFSSFVLYDADSGSSIMTFQSFSGNYNTMNDYYDIRTNLISVGSTSRRFGIKVSTKQASGTMSLSQYLTYVKVVEV